MAFPCGKSSCTEVFETTSQRKAHIRRIHQSTADIKYPGGHVERGIPRDPVDNRFHCRICNNYSNDIASNLQKHVNSCPSFRTHMPALPVVASAIVPVVPSVRPVSFAPVDLSVPNVLPIATSTMPLDSSVDVVNVPAESTYDNIDNIQIESTQAVDTIEVDTTVYNAEYESLGIVIHLQSGSIICVCCRYAVQIENVIAHFGRHHSLNKRITEYNTLKQQHYDELSQEFSEPLTIHNLQDKIRDEGAVSYNEHGLYTAPLKNPLPVVSLLPLLPGFMCNFCPVQDVTAVATFTGTASTMTKHMQRMHRGLDHNQYTTCHVQHLYNDQGHKVYFKVEQPYSGPTTQSTITAEGDALFDQFLNENPDYDEGFNPDATIGDSRAFSRFYEYVNWFNLVVDVTGEDTNKNRLLMIILILISPKKRWMSLMILIN